MWVRYQVSFGMCSLWRRLRHDEAGSIPEWVMLLVMAVGVILAIMVFFGDSVADIVRDQLQDVTRSRPSP